MKRLIPILLVSIITCDLKAQITIDSSDFSHANETVVYSQVSPLTTVDPTLTGPNYTWDFSQFMSIGQQADTFVTPASFGNLYSLFFIDNSFNPNRSNLVVRGSFPTFPGVTITDVYNFYFKSATAYSQVGLGGTINGTQAPVPYTDKDIVYAFPLDYGDMDTSVSNFGITLPGLGSYYGNQTRIVTVDGWGNVETPFGTFDCLREVATLTGHDSVYIDSLALGIGFDRTLTRQYKWIAKGQDGPVLQITTQEILAGTETITEIIYRDSVVISGVETVEGENIIVYPNPSDDRLNIRIPESSSVKAIAIFNPQGQMVLVEPINSLQRNLTISVKDLASGLYFIQAEGATSSFKKKIIITHK